MKKNKLITGIVVIILLGVVGSVFGNRDSNTGLEMITPIRGRKHL